MSTTADRVWAVGRPTLYLPAGLLLRLTAGQRAAVVAHELTHLRRWDHVVRAATFLFAAGQETVVKLLSASTRMLAENPDLQDKLRGDRSLIGNFIEESLRIESPTKVDFRLARKTTKRL